MENNHVSKSTIYCRGCGKELACSFNVNVYNPDTGEQAKQNFYGGFVCCRQCDVDACLRMSSSMPGAGIARHLNTMEREYVERNWREEC